MKILGLAVKISRLGDDI